MLLLSTLPPAMNSSSSFSANSAVKCSNNDNEPPRCMKSYVCPMNPRGNPKIKDRTASPHAFVTYAPSLYTAPSPNLGNHDLKHNGEQRKSWVIKSRRKKTKTKKSQAIPPNMSQETNKSKSSKGKAMRI